MNSAKEAAGEEEKDTAADVEDDEDDERGSATKPMRTPSSLHLQTLTANIQLTPPW